jgi:hypothetical protein
MLEHKFIPADVALFFQEKLARHGVDIDDIRNGRLGELHQREGPGHARVGAGAERYDLQCDLGKLGGLGKVPELPIHHLPPADLAAQRGLVDDPPELERAVAAQDVLPFHPDLDPPLDLIAAGGREPAADHGPGVVLGLQQAGHEQRLVVPDAAGLPLEADIGGVLLGQHRLVRVQPATLAGVPKQSDQFVLMRPLDPVQVE